MDALLAAAAVLAPVGAAVPLVPLVPPPVVAPLFRRTTIHQRHAIVALHEDHQPYRTIARKLGVSKTSVGHWIRQYQLNGDVADRPRSGRPRCTDEVTDHNIVLTAVVAPFTSPRQIRRSLGLIASARTIDRRRQQAGLVGRVARHKRDYSEAEIRKRLSFANGYADKSVDWWEHVLFSDEKCFDGTGFCGRTWCRRPVGTALDPQYCVGKTAHPVKVNVWACFSASGQGYCHIFNENMDAVLMKKILEANLLPSARLLHLLTDPPQPWFLLHDNDKKFTSNLVKEFIHNNGVTCLEFPPYSPDR